MTQTDFTFIGSFGWESTMPITFIYSFFKSPINKISLEIGLQNVSFTLLLPILNYTLWTTPFLSGSVPTTQAVDQQLCGCCSSLSSTMSPIWKFLVILFHFCLSWRVAQKFFMPSGPKLVHHVLHSSPSLLGIQIWEFKSSR